MGESTATSTSTTGSSNPMVTDTVNQLLSGLQASFAQGPTIFTESLYPGVSQTTKDSWAMGKDSANNATYTQGIDNAMSYTAGMADGSGPSLTEQTLMGVAKGDYLNSIDPNYQATTDRTANQMAADINAAMGGSGRYGSNMHVANLADEIGAYRTDQAWQNMQRQEDRQMEALSAIEGLRQQDVNNSFAAQGQLSNLYSAAQLPAAVLGSIGASEDADMLATRQGWYDQHERIYGGYNDWLAELSGILTGGAQSSGTTTTTTEPTTPWYEQVIGYVLGNAGKAASSYAGK